MALFRLSSQPISLGSEAFLHACFLPVDDRQEMLRLRSCSSWKSPRSSGPVVLILRSLEILGAAPPGGFFFESHAQKVEHRGTCMLPQNSVD